MDVNVKVIVAGGVGIGNSNPNVLFCTTLVGGKGPLSCLGYFNPEKNSTGTNRLFGSESHRFGLDTSEKRKLTFSCWGSKHDSSTVQPVV
jgi:hypothetical protein